jgi:hypothetical protein
METPNHHYASSDNPFDFFIKYHDNMNPQVVMLKFPEAERITS